ncbi:MAG: hypothetical protein A2097_06215 [Desulfobacula sp. GWF2_41_7]|nr:MAG: hypothetical protein A2097_06215 [Desulfobacula sp. GWF2_41_7]
MAKDTLGKLKEQERELRQTLITEAARNVFGEKTYDQVSMAEIAKAAGISKSSIYTYFSSQEELYARIVHQDACAFILELNRKIRKKEVDVINLAIDYFLDYYIEKQSQWRMITHFALHGNKNMESIDKLNEIGRGLMDAFEMVFVLAGCKSGTRLLAHTLFSCLSGILIAFRNYPGRPEHECIAHMKKIATQVEAMMKAYIEEVS